MILNKLHVFRSARYCVIVRVGLRDISVCIFTLSCHTRQSRVGDLLLNE